MRIIQRILIICLIGVVPAGCQEKIEYDVAILNGMVFDGNGSPGRILDIGIRGEKIVYVGKISPRLAKKVIDANGLVVAPGFIDMHTHIDKLVTLPGVENFLRQGVTTAFGGPDGGGPWPFVPYLDSISQMNFGINVAFLVGHNNIRKQVIGMDDRKPTSGELDEMRRYVKQAMQAGAFGISTGLKYLPGIFSDTEEVIALAEVAAQYDGIYTSHIRDEGRQVLEGVGETIEIGSKAKLPVIITHHKVVGKPMWGKSRATLKLIEEARENGVDVYLDQYPYTASSTGIGILLPSWALEGGHDRYVERLGDKTLYDSMKAQVIDNLVNDRGGDDLTRVQFASVEWDPSLNGQTLYDLCILKDRAPTAENAAELVMDAQRQGSTQCVFHAMHEEDVKRIMNRPYTAIASDGALTVYGEGVPHPRSYGTFPRILHKYVKSDSTLELAEAIHKMSGLPSEITGLKERGLIEEGYFADIVIFNLTDIAEKGTFTSPHQYPEGIRLVLVNGKVSLENDVLKERPGRLLRKDLISTR